MMTVFSLIICDLSCNDDKKGPVKQVNFYKVYLKPGWFSIILPPAATRLFARQNLNVSAAVITTMSPFARIVVRI